MSKLSYEATVYPYNGDGKLKAFANLTIGGEFVVKGLRVMEGSNGLFVAMPSKQVNEEWKDTAFPLSKEARQKIQDAVLAKFEEADTGSDSTEPAGTSDVETEIDDDDIPF